MALRLSQFTGKFKGGARPNLFKVAIAEGPSYIQDVNENMEILGQGASLPAATIGEIIVPYMGRQHKIPGNRTYDTWDITIINDTDFEIRNAFHRWQEDINNPETNLSDRGAAGRGDIYGQFEVLQLDSDGIPLKSYVVHNAWPSVVSDIELNWESNDALETFTVTLNYSHWTQGDPAGALSRAWAAGTESLRNTVEDVLRDAWYSR